LSLCSTTQPLFSRFTIIFGSCFSKVTIGYNPNTTPRRGRRGEPERQAAVRGHDSCETAPTRQREVLPANIYTQNPTHREYIEPHAKHKCIGFGSMPPRQCVDLVFKLPYGNMLYIGKSGHFTLKISHRKAPKQVHKTFQISDGSHRILGKKRILWAKSTHCTSPRRRGLWLVSR
jgi:hypothetical protein